jgi:hypothetical protein
MSLDIKRKQLELARVQMAKNELEFKVEEKMEEVDRIKGLIELQSQKESELKEEIQRLKGE